MDQVKGAYEYVISRPLVLSAIVAVVFFFLGYRYASSEGYTSVMVQKPMKQEKFSLPFFRKAAPKKEGYKMKFYKD